MIYLINRHTFTVGLFINRPTCRSETGLPATHSASMPTSGKAPRHSGPAGSRRRRSMRRTAASAASALRGGGGGVGGFRCCLLGDVCADLYARTTYISRSIEA